MTGGGESGALMGVAGARAHDFVVLNRGSVAEGLKTLQGAAHGVGNPDLYVTARRTRRKGA